MQQYATSSQLQTLQIALPPSGKKKISRASICAKMDPMQIQLGVGTKNHSVYCYVFLKSGTLTHYEDGEYVPTEIRDWRIAFKVNIDLQAMEKKDVPVHIKKQLAKAGDYSVKKLILDFTTADVINYDEKKSLLPGLPNEDDPTLTAERQVHLGTLLKSWIEDLKKQTDEGHTHNILGYSVSVGHPKAGYPTGPTLVPTSMTHQNYHFLASRGSSPVSDLFGADKETGNNNMLLYLEMTNHNLLPEAALNYSANWVVNEPGQPVKDGTLAIASKCFFENYLLPKLAIVNRNTAIKALRAEHHGYEVNEIHFDFQIGKTFDENSDPKSYQWKKADQPLSWVFEDESSKGSTNNSFPSRTLGIYGTLSCSVSNTVQVDPGSNEIRLAGHIMAKKSRNANFFNGGNYYFEQHWSITIKFESVEKGGLVAKAEKYIEEPRISSDKNGHAFAQDDMMHAQQLKDIIGNALNMEKTIEDINRIFSGPWDFYFPGSGVFLLKSPKFNNEGDLLVELDYVEGGEEE
ncbi:hypothetical protein RhiJN_23163 [Ceratobasidium sp. AG-Ba]|nr:hypothetical protein RhiJN_23163 [Ceratobasidium sp. AG-Ba]